jgi:hypothetical protein
MASGFIILKDGRCFSRRWTTHDYVINLVIKELSGSNDKEVIEFKNWLLTLLPAEEDEYNGYGGFLRKSTGENIQRRLDLRELTVQNQELFWSALQNTLTKLITNKDAENADKDSLTLLRHLLKMKHLADIGDDPDNLSDWQKGYIEPSSNKRSGPGW